MIELPLRRLARIINGGTPTADAVHWGGDVQWATPVDLGRVDGKHISSTVRTLTLAGLLDGSSLVEPGSVLLSTRAPIGYVAINDEPMSFNQGCRGLSPRHNVLGDYLRYALLHLRPQLQAAGTGSTFMEISGQALGDIKVPLIGGLETQRSVVASLDRETAKIDALIAKQQSLISLLSERRTSLIRAVLTEKHPDWARLQIRRLSPVLRGASPRPIDDPIYFDEEGSRGWVRISDVTRSGGRLAHTEQKLSRLGCSLSVPLEPGDLFLSIAASVGKPCIPEIPVCIHDGFVYFPELWWPTSEWLFRVFELGDCFGGLGKLGTQLNLNTDTVGGIKVWLPPTEHQEALLRELDSALPQLDDLVAHAESLSTVLRERRTALITAAVTGQIDVETYGRAQPAESVTS